jgi:multiple sugar transport system substrate-binding protein
MVRALRALGALTAVLALVTACTAAPAAEGPVQVLLFGDPEELAAYRTLVDAYHEQSGGKRVELVEASDRADLIARLSTSIAGGKPPDAFLMNYRYYGQFAAKNAIVPLDERLGTGADQLDATKLYPQALAAFQWQGKQLCLPQNVSSLAVYYNRALFQRFGVPEPKQGWTWNDLVTTAQALTRDGRGIPVNAGESDGASPVATWGLGVEPTLIRIAPFVWSAGGDIVDDPAKPTRLTFDTPAAREALRQFIDLRVAYGVVPTDQEVEAQDDETRFANGGLAMVLSSRRLTTTLRGVSGLDWDVAPLPAHTEPAGILHSDAYCITSGSGRQDAAWDFVRFALGPQGARAIAATGRTVPSNMEVSRSAAFLDPTKPPQNAQVFLDAIETVRRTPTISTWPEIEDVTNGILENALYRGDSLDDVIAALDEQTRPLFARAEMS